MGPRGTSGTAGVRVDKYAESSDVLCIIRIMYCIIRIIRIILIQGPDNRTGRKVGRLVATDAYFRRDFGK